MTGSITSPPRITPEQAAERAKQQAAMKAAQPTATVRRGVGTELTKLIMEYGLSEKAGCNCGPIAAELDGWGVDQAERRRDEIIAHLAKNRAKASWVEMVMAGTKAVANGLPLTLGGLVDEAVRRARIASSS